jgi:hypothetical protein
MSTIAVLCSMNDIETISAQSPISRQRKIVRGCIMPSRSLHRPTSIAGDRQPPARLALLAPGGHHRLRAASCAQDSQDFSHCRGVMAKPGLEVLFQVRRYFTQANASMTSSAPAVRPTSAPRPKVAVIASVAKQSPGGCAPSWGLPRRFAPNKKERGIYSNDRVYRHFSFRAGPPNGRWGTRNDSEPADRPPFRRSPDWPEAATPPIRARWRSPGAPRSTARIHPAAPPAPTRPRSRRSRQPAPPPPSGRQSR